MSFTSMAGSRLCSSSIARPEAEFNNEALKEPQTTHATWEMPDERPGNGRHGLDADVEPVGLGEDVCRGGEGGEQAGDHRGRGDQGQAGEHGAGLLLVVVVEHQPRDVCHRLHELRDVAVSQFGLRGDLGLPFLVVSLKVKPNKM